MGANTPSAGGRYKIVTVTVDAAVSAVPVHVMAVELWGNNADISADLTNDADGSGTTVVTIAAAAEQGGCFRDYTNIGGIWFSSKCYCDITTTAGAAYFWIDS